VSNLKSQLEAKAKQLDDIKMQVVLKGRSKGLDFEDILQAYGTGSHVEEARKELYKKDEHIRALEETLERETKKSSRMEAEKTTLTDALSSKVDKNVKETLEKQLDAEKKAHEDERDQILKNLQNRVDRVIELEMELDQYKEK